MRFFRMDRAEHDPENPTVFSQPELQTMADSAVGKEARRVCAILHQPRVYTSSDSRALRAAVGGRHADYLFSRFGRNLGFNTLADAQEFYDCNKRSTDGWGR